MNSLIITLLKIGAVAIYLATAASFFVEGFVSFQDVLIYTTGILFALHIVEYIVVKSRLEKLSLDKNHFLQTFLFGFLYWLPLLKK